MKASIEILYTEWLAGRVKTEDLTIEERRIIHLLVLNDALRPSKVVDIKFRAA